MVAEIDIWRLAWAMLKADGAEIAQAKALKRADELEALGARTGAAVMRRVAATVVELKADKVPPGAPLQ